MPALPRVPDIQSNLFGKWMDCWTIDITGLLKEFQKIWAERAEKYLPGLLYLETAPYGLLTAFDQRVVNWGPRSSMNTRMDYASPISLSSTPS
ncbi:MAG: hypothetical protein LBJ61_00125 [Deltaproteobacteria bacterium]|nr:hypothetical protein [Deltaproteobacteria bacterium]